MTRIDWGEIDHLWLLLLEDADETHLDNLGDQGGRKGNGTGLSKEKVVKEVSVSGNWVVSVIVISSCAGFGVTTTIRCGLRRLSRVRRHLRGGEKIVQEIAR